MNIIFEITRVTIPTWSMGVGSLIVNLLSYILFGIVVMYVISKSKIEVND